MGGADTLGPYRAWDTYSGAERLTFFRDMAWAAGVVFVPPQYSTDRRYCAQVSRQVLPLVDLHESREWPAIVKLEPKHSSLPRFSPGGTFVCIADRGKDAKLRVIESATANHVATLPVSFRYGFHLFSADDELLGYFAPGDKQGLFTVWNTRTRQVERTMPEVLEYDPSSWVLAPDGKTFLAHGIVDKEEAVALWDMRTGEKRELPWFASLDQRRRPVLFSVDGKTLVAVRDELAPGDPVCQFQIWDVATCQKRAVIKLDRLENDINTLRIVGNGRFLTSTDWNPPRATVWDLTTAKELWHREGAPEDLGNVQYVSPNDRVVIAATPKRMDVLDIATGELRASLALSEKALAGQRLTCTPDGQSMYTYFEVVSLQDRSLLQRWLGKWWPIEPKSRWRAIVANVDSARLRFSVEVDWLSATKLSDDGKTLVTSCSLDDGVEIQCWDVPARTRWGWVLGVPAALAGLAGGVRCMRARTRGKTTACA